MEATLGMEEAVHYLDDENVEEDIDEDLDGMWLIR